MATKGSTKMDGCLLILVHYILLYNIDGIENQLKNPKKISQLQAQYCSIFLKYLKSCHTEEVARKLLGKGIMLVQETERAYELSQKTLKLT